MAIAGDDLEIHLVAKGGDFKVGGSGSRGWWVPHSLVRAFALGLRRGPW